MVGAGPPGVRPPPQVLERAASTSADSQQLWPPPGARPARTPRHLAAPLAHGAAQLRAAPRLLRRRQRRALRGHRRRCALRLRGGGDNQGRGARHLWLRRARAVTARCDAGRGRGSASGVSDGVARQWRRSLCRARLRASRGGGGRRLRSRHVGGVGAAARGRGFGGNVVRRRHLRAGIVTAGAAAFTVAPVHGRP